MNYRIILEFLVAIFFSVCSTAIMSYISMATPIGPWIETTLVLAAMLIFSLFFKYFTQKHYTNALGLTTIAGGIGGILATGFGFSFPTFYFIDKPLFLTWLQNPLWFALALSSIGLAAGSLGFLMADICEAKFIERERLPFPIGELIYKMISAPKQLGQALWLALGFLSTIFYLYIQQLSQFLSRQLSLITKPIALASGITIPTLIFPLDQIPMFIAIGFITGHVIALPLLYGLLSKIICIDPLHYFYPHIHTFINSYILPLINVSLTYKPINAFDFSIAFSSGIVLYGALGGILYIPKMLYKWGKDFFKGSSDVQSYGFALSCTSLLSSIVILAVNFFVLYWFQFSILAQLYLIVFTCICIYQMLYIAGKIGLAPLGRFATFVLLPALFLFKLNSVQITLIATYVEVAGGVACDVLFGRRMAYLGSFDKKKVQLFQWLGLLVSALLVGFIVWILIITFGLGSESGQLAVNKAFSRALLINCKNFDFLVLLLGFIFGYVLTFTRVSPVLVLGGILMQPYISIMLITGGLLTYLFKQKEDYYPLWSGIFAANSLWMILKAFFSNLA